MIVDFGSEIGEGFPEEWMDWMGGIFAALPCRLKMERGTG
jgi:hypothetical protein